LGQSLGDAFLDVEPLDGGTILPGIAERSPNGRPGREFEIGVLKYDHRILAAEFEDDRCQILCGGRGDPLAGGDRTGEHYLVGNGLNEGRTGRSVTRDDLDCVLCGKARLSKYLTDLEAGKRGKFRGLDNDRISSH
jgi:hypothetical protein